MYLGSRKHRLPLAIIVSVIFSAGSSMAVGAEGKGISPLGDTENPKCRTVYAIGEKREVVKCPAGEIYTFCLTRNIVDRADFITGRFEYFSDPSKGPTPLDDPSGNLAVIYGVGRITTRDGVLELGQVSILQKKIREFAGIDYVTGGTGQFAGYSGTLISGGKSTGKSFRLGTLCRE